MSQGSSFANINNIKLHCFDNLYRQYAEKHPTYLQNSKTLATDNGYPLQFYINEYWDRRKFITDYFKHCISQ